MTKTVIIILLIAMLVVLAIALRQLLKTPEENDDRKTFLKALQWRIGIWVVLFSFIVISMKMGWIKPSNSPNPANFNQEQLERMESEGK
ncbi:MAG: DUF2909 domain-containing protein [Acidiferrobacterales bacterium]|nr:DUF2909 domain-containing protein [Acidiferrobacterales bacterium]